MLEIGDATDYKEKGNACYREGKLVKALKVYHEAHKQAPAEPWPSSNISACYLELGRYAQSITWAQRATELALDQGVDNHTQLLQKLEARMDKARLYSPKEPLLGQARLRILKELPRYRPSKFLHLVYYGVGHDDASSLCGEVLMKERALEKPNARVSLFFAGIGDARNLFATLVDIMKQEKRSKACRHLRYHFTLNDVKAPTLARDLLILLLLDELAQMTDYSSGAAREVLATIFFTFIGTIVPAYVFKHLQGIISKALCLLRSESRPLPWLHIYKANLPAVIKTLSSWQKEAFEAYSTAYFIDIVRNGMMPNRGPDSPTSSMFRSKLPKSCQYEQEGYYRTALLLLPNESLKEHDLGLWKLIQGNEALKPSQRAQGVKEYLQKSWRINVTLLDPELLYMPPWQQLVFNPFNLASDLYSLSVVEAPRNPTKLYDYVAPFFVETAKALKSLKNRILMEMIVGDCCDVLEGLRLGLLDHRNSGPLSKEGEQSVLPTSYDRVHLSNIPDYTGGHLSTLLYALPATRTGPLSYITANCLLTTCRWSSNEDHLTEFLMITDCSMLEKLMQATFFEQRKYPTEPWPLDNYQVFARSTSQALGFTDLLPRDDFNKWFYALFFKIALPMNWEEQHNCPAGASDTCKILSPLNLTVLFRLLSHLSSVGYPAHWLVEIITNLLSDKVVTTGRPPRESPLTIKSAKRQHPAKKLSTALFIPELRTLTSMLECTLPFSLPASVPHPPLENIALYTICLPEWLRSYKPEWQKNLVLIFLNDIKCFSSMQVNEKRPFLDLRPFLDPSWDEVEDPYRHLDSDMEKRWFKDLKMVLWSTFEWDSEAKMAKAWMDRSFIEKADEENWWCGIWKVDTWEPLLDRLGNVSVVVEEVKKWDVSVDEVDLSSLTL